MELLLSFKFSPGAEVPAEVFTFRPGSETLPSIFSRQVKIRTLTFSGQGF